MTVVVISNTSPLTNLAAIGQFALLRELYGELLIAEAVWAELNAGGHAWPGCAEVAGAAWITRRAVMNRPLVTALRERLDGGEAETIALALECPPSFVLMDEKEGRHTAHRFGLSGVDLFWPSPLRVVTPDNRHWRLEVGSKGEMLLLSALLVAAAAL